MYVHTFIIDSVTLRNISSSIKKKVSCVSNFKLYNQQMATTLNEMFQHIIKTNFSDFPQKSYTDGFNNVPFREFRGFLNQLGNPGDAITSTCAVTRSRQTYTSVNTCALFKNLFKTASNVI